MVDLIIQYSFYLLFFLTPLFWTSQNYELFEFNKMFLTYGITIVIIGAWIFKMINDKRLTIKRTPLDIPLLLFLGSQILSTVFSIDIHTSVWGYYSRLNGGLVSTITYLLLYWAFVSNMNWQTIKKALWFGLISGAIISLWAISEHFGVSPSCVILRGNFDDNCWVQDVQARVFATLGQPNWLAGYLAMLIFPALYFFLTTKNRILLTTYYLLLTTLYLAFTFTYSRGPTLGLIGGMVIFVAVCLRSHSGSVNRKLLFSILASFLAINVLFGSALTSFRLVSKFAAPPRPAIELPTTSTSQLETGGTESGQIRLIVWQGAWDIFKHYPLFGSGVETFAYSYYQFRPIAHNQTSEWDFLYNKAHNEYLNYLATTGIVGFGTYMLVIGAFLWWSVKKIYNLQGTIYKKGQVQNFTLYILPCTLLAGYVSYLIYNFFLFSVVIIAIFFFLFPAMAFVATDSTKSLKISNLKFQILNYIYRRAIYTYAIKTIVVLFTIYLLFSTYRLWYADTLFAQGQGYSDNGNPGRAYNLISEAVNINKSEPFYRSELAFNAASSALALQETEATLSAALADEADAEMDFVLQTNPKNISYWRTAIRTYFVLENLDKKYSDKTLNAIDTAIELAPTDPKLYLNKAKILYDLDKKDQAMVAIRMAIQLKPDYLDATDQLKQWEEATKSAKTR